MLKAGPAASAVVTRQSLIESGVGTPPEPVDATAALRAEIAALHQRLTDSESAVTQARQRAEAEAREREGLAERLAREAAERALWEQLAQESETTKAEIAARLAALQAEASQTPRTEVADLAARAEAAAQHLDLDEADTRTLIDAQLRDRGWEADTPALRHLSLSSVEIPVR